MELRILKNFLVVVREENISRAAEVLHIAQPALSRQMSQLEEELGTQLFIRGKRLVLTDAGIMLRQRAEEVTSLIAKIKNEFEEQTETGGIISIGGGGLTALQSLTPIFDSFRRKYPKVQYHFYTNSADYIKEKLEQGLLDFGVLLEPTDVSKFDYLRMPVKEKWGLLFQAKSPLAAKRNITKKDLASLPLIVSDRSAIQKELESWLGKELSKLDVFGTYNIITHVAAVVDSGAVGWFTALKSEKIKAIAAYEPGGSFPFVKEENPTAEKTESGQGETVEVSEAELTAYTKFPIIIYYGDFMGSDDRYTEEQKRWHQRLRIARHWADTVNKRGGDVTVVHLPEAGVKGNTHFPFSDLNNVEIADLLSGWLHAKGLD
ncbi:MAG: LysR family transcriptional regulator [Alphaproteobacteria bacterium]|nr:LysR family transcriptional regulator [Alphaproteobacteria bacterium]